MYFLIFCWYVIYVQCAIILLSWYSITHYLLVFVILCLVFCLCKLLDLWLVDYFDLGCFLAFLDLGIFYFWDLGSGLGIFWHYWDFLKTKSNQIFSLYFIYI